MSRIDVIGQNGNDGLHYEDPIVESVRAKLLSRSQVGLSKYGVGLDRQDLSRLDWLRHLHEEMLDACCYLERILQDETK